MLHPKEVIIFQVIPNYGRYPGGYGFDLIIETEIRAVHC